MYFTFIQPVMLIVFFGGALIGSLYACSYVSEGNVQKHAQAATRAMIVAGNRKILVGYALAGIATCCFIAGMSFVI